MHELGYGGFLEHEKSISESLEGMKLGRGHLKVMLISGMSFFTDAYDLFVIGVVLLMIKPIFALGATQMGIVASAALFGAVLGPFLFGIIGDRLGRKAAYWMTVVILIVGALGSATSATYLQLFVWRFILGIGIGGDYPLSATIVAEYANKDDRGKLISSTFAMQGFGIVAGIGIAFLLLYMNVPSGLAWRVLLAIGAIPTLTILYARTKLLETPVYSIAKGKLGEAQKAITDVLGKGAGAAKGAALAAERYGIELKFDRPNVRELVRKWWKVLIGTSLSWFLLDISYYGTGIFTPYLTTFFGFSGVFGPTKATALLLLAFAVPGYWVAVALIDREGRKAIQTIGFFVMGALFLVLAVFGHALLARYSLLFFALYGLTFFFSNYGPNTTTYVYPVELFPTHFRARGHGIAAMSGKMGAAISVLFFPLLIEKLGKFGVIGMLGAIALVGGVVTLAFLPETKRKPLRETSREAELTMVTSTLYGEFSSLMGHIVQGSKLVSEMFANDSAETYFAKVKKEEHLADNDVHSIMDYIANVRVNSVLYMDISHFASNLDSVMDGLEAVAARMAMYKVAMADKTMRKFAAINEECIGEVATTLGTLDGLLAGKSAGQEILERYKRVTKLENEADKLLRDSLAGLMDGRDVKHIIVYKEIYEKLERVSDRCVDAMDIVNDMVLRYEYGR